MENMKCHDCLRKIQKEENYDIKSVDIKSVDIKNVNIYNNNFHKYVSEYTVKDLLEYLHR